MKVGMPRIRDNSPLRVSDIGLYTWPFDEKSFSLTVVCYTYPTLVSNTSSSRR